MGTEPGVVMGTVPYMSPEQARGKDVDARTDIWSLGVVLYEMVSGRLPFEGTTTSDVIGLILHKEPITLVRFAPDVPSELERIVTKALRKDKEERYQVVKDLALDLKSLKQRLEFEAELERTGKPERDRAARPAATSDDIPTTSSAEYIGDEIKRHKRGVLLIIATLVAATVAVAYFANSRYFAGSGEAGIRSIAVLPFVNVSADQDAEYLSDGITEGIINSLSQLPQLKVIARSSVFKYKGKEMDPQEVAQALGVEAILTGRVTQRGDNLLISVAMDARDKTRCGASSIGGDQVGDDTSSTQIYLGAAYARAGGREKAQAILKRLQTSKEYVSPGGLAALYAALGGREQEFASLEKAYAAHDLQLQYLGVDPSLDTLRSDPRFTDLLRRVGLPQ